MHRGHLTRTGLLNNWWLYSTVTLHESIYVVGWFTEVSPSPHPLPPLSTTTNLLWLSFFYLSVSLLSPPPPSPPPHNRPLMTTLPKSLLPLPNWPLTTILLTFHLLPSSSTPYLAHLCPTFPYCLHFIEHSLTSLALSKLMYLLSPFSMSSLPRFQSLLKLNSFYYCTSPASLSHVVLSLSLPPPPPSLSACLTHLIPFNLTFSNQLIYTFLILLSPLWICPCISGQPGAVSSLLQWAPLWWPSPRWSSLCHRGPVECFDRELPLTLE